MSMGAGTSKPSIPDRDDEELLQNIGGPLRARHFEHGLKLRHWDPKADAAAWALALRRLTMAGGQRFIVTLAGGVESLRGPSIEAVTESTRMNAAQKQDLRCALHKHALRSRHTLPAGQFFRLDVRGTAAT